MVFYQHILAKLAMIDYFTLESCVFDFAVDTRDMLVDHM